MVTILTGDCREVLKTLDSASVDSIVTDPPYGLRFMGKAWDYDVPVADVWRECLRVLKPGGHLLAFSGTRTQHRMAVRIEDAGFEIRDMIAWVYGSGFPKSKNLHGAMKGWGSALKPAMELITVARNPLCGTIAANVQKWGTGAVNVDGCRIPNDEPIQERGTGRIYRNGQKHSLSAWRRAEGRKDLPSNHPQMTGGHVHGRWPANLIHDGSAEVVGLFPEKAGGGFPQVRKAAKTAGIYGAFAEGHCQKGPRDMGSGSAARFFYCAKASQQERGVNNRHPTVKPIRLMRYLCRLVTPSGGKVLDPFAGTGTTGVAAASEGFDAVLVELNPEYAKLATDRCGLFCSPNATNLPRSEAE